jgi:tripartite-type tricarboxylate transporter receptor subunit TctC
VKEARMMRRRARLAMLPLAGALLFCATGAAQERPPGKAVTLIVAGSAGDALDRAGRTFAEALASSLGQAVAVQNVPGAMTIGLTRIHGAPRDGSTLGMVGSFAITAPLSGAVPFGPKDLSYLAHLGRDTFVLAVPASSPYRTLRDYLAAGSGVTPPISIGTAGPGTLSQVAAASIAQVAAVNLAITPLPGSAGVLAALHENRVASGIILQSDVGPHAAHGGGPRPLATFGDIRLARLSSVPTAAEQNLTGVPAGPWLGVGAPPGLGEPVRRSLVAAIERAAEDLKWKGFVQGQGLTGALMTGPTLERFIESDVEALRLTMLSLGLLVR